MGHMGIWLCSEHGGVILAFGQSDLRGCLQLCL